MRSLFLLFALMLCAPSASAEIFAISLKDSAPGKVYQKHLVSYRGMWVLMGEAKSGFVVDAKTGAVQWDTAGPNEMFVFDPKKPGAPAYYVKDAEKVPSSRKHVLEVEGQHIERSYPISRDQTLPGLSTQYEVAAERIKELRKERKAQPTQSAPWFHAHHRVVVALEAQERWLKSFGFSKEVGSIQRELEKERALALESPQTSRAENARASVRLGEVPEALLRVSKEEFGGKHVFHTVESEHFLMHYLVAGNSDQRQHVSDEWALSLVHLAEQVVEGFRAEHVDPYIGEDYPDTISDGLLGTWFFGPFDDKAYLRYCAELLDFERSSLAGETVVSGEVAYGGSPVRYQFLWRLDQLDLDGAVCHQTGHVLAMMHYGSDEGPIRSAWLEESVANAMATQYMGHCGATCWGIREGLGYLQREAQKPGKRGKALERRSMYDYIALTQGASIKSVALKRLYELGDVDLAKAWSFYDYVARFEGKQGQLFLRAAGEFSRINSTLIENWRERAAEIYGVSQREGLDGVETRWREHVEALRDDVR